MNKKGNMSTEEIYLHLLQIVYNSIKELGLSELKNEHIQIIKNLVDYMTENMDIPFLEDESKSYIVSCYNRLFGEGKEEYMNRASDMKIEENFKYFKQTILQELEENLKK